MLQLWLFVDRIVLVFMKEKTMSEKIAKVTIEYVNGAKVSFDCESLEVNAEQDIKVIDDCEGRIYGREFRNKELLIKGVLETVKPYFVPEGVDGEKFRYYLKNEK